MQRTRLTLDLSEKLHDKIVKIASENETSKADVRFAVELLQAVENMKKEGFTVGGWKEETGQKTIRELVY